MFNYALVTMRMIEGLGLSWWGWGLADITSSLLPFIGDLGVFKYYVFD